ncbi:MAG: BolA family transcriptional regulator [Alphaproteobacteria bacterium CG11_big_fil_rev_8_21_14_0_20_39_49]|nr:MAG: BolA family transcriptional regulator [Alphaproteobacteria bacterium CG11_big_fil_rev_8_21_14_0_20_39_49]
MTIFDRINRKLNEQLSIFKLKVEDESHKHQGHAGYIEGGETHFKIEVVTDDFIGKSKVARHKTIYKILGQEIEDRIHALSVTALTKDEYNNKTKN